MGMKFGKLNKRIKKYCIWKWTYGADEQDHLEEQRLQMK
jgi:hypothetical protein